MNTPQRTRHLGFVLIEALIALMLIGIGLLAVSKLQSMGLSSSGESRSRTEASNLSQKKLEELRNIVQKSSFTALAAGSTTVTGSNAAYEMAWSVSTPDAALDQRLLQLTTTWTGANGVPRRLDLNSLIAWDDPGAQVKAVTDTSGSLISPTGSAQRGTGTLSISGTAQNADGTRLKLDANGTTYLLSGEGTVLLSLPPKDDGSTQSFTTITGRVLFDKNAGNNALPSSANVRVRLSSEGECVYNNAVSNLVEVAGGSNAYRYFTYTCYVGPGWYGNVAVVIDSAISGQEASPTVCVGDPGFNNGTSNSTLISAHPVETSLRSYRGFKGSSGSYRSTGVASASRYGLTYLPGGSAAAGPFDGRPRPSQYPTSYPSMTVGSSADYFNQDFLLTKVNNQSSCASKMSGGVFTRNAGKYVCINPDNDAASDACPNVWPGFEGEVGNGGSINQTLDVDITGSGSGIVTIVPGNVVCGGLCTVSFASGTTVTLTATAAIGSSFAGWSGCTSTSGNLCTLTMSAGANVVASFDVGTAHALTLSKAGTGAGAVSSSPAGIDCPASCLTTSATYNAGTSVTLSATAASGSQFTGWTGACSGTGACTVSMSSAQTVGASFSGLTLSTTLTVTKTGAGSGSVVSSPSGINCGSTCSASVPVGSVMTLTATPVAGSAFAGWSGGGCSGTGSCTVTVSAASTVSAAFTQNAVCTTPISGSAHDKNGSVTASPTAYGSCAMAGGNSSVYSCSFSAPTGTAITLTNARTTGQTYSFSMGVTANCAAQTNVNFP